MKENTAKLLDRAKDSIEAADILLTNEKVDIAAGGLTMQCFIQPRLY